MRDAGYKRYVDDRNTWITTSDKCEHARNYHCSAWERKSRDYDIGHRESLSYRPPDDESADSEMNSRSDEAVKAHFRGPFLLSVLGGGSRHQASFCRPSGALCLIYIATHGWRRGL